MDLNDKALNAKAKEHGKIHNSMPSKADMIAVFGKGCVEEMPDGEMRYYIYRPGATREQKIKAQAKFDELMAKTRGLQCDRSDRIDQERQDLGVKIIHPNGTIYHADSSRMEDHAAKKRGFRPVTSIGQVVYSGVRAPWLKHNGVLRKA